ncbi:MAG: hydrolase family protein [Thermoleophilia bacterium]|nr:hydrolase family protein [Thermoleophilia bacterium]
MGRRSLLRAPVLVATTGVVAAVAVLAAEVEVARRREYAVDPGFDIDALIPGDAPTIELVVAGDSTAAGLGVAAVAETLPVQIAERMARDTGRAVHVIGLGASGAKVADVLRSQLPQVALADALVIAVGSNDAVQMTNVGSLERDLERLLLDARAHVDVVVLGGAGRLDTPNFLPPLRQLVAWRARMVRALQQRIAARCGCGFVDIGGDVADRFAATTNHTSSDGFHPAAAGYGVWADALADRAVELLPGADTDSLGAGASRQRLD